MRVLHDRIAGRAKEVVRIAVQSRLSFGFNF